MSTLIWLVILGLNIFAILDILKSGKSGAMRILWIVIVLLVPVLGVAAYFIIGRKK